jgi:hypothetical protein
LNISFNKTRVFIALPLVSIIIFAVLALYAPFDSVVTDAEMEVLDFRPSSLKIITKTIIARTINREDPFDFAYVKPVPGHDSRHGEHKPEANVSLIVISGKKKMAVIDGRTVKEGDSIGGMRIAKIESNRILLQDRSSQWLYIKEEQ